MMSDRDTQEGGGRGRNSTGVMLYIWLWGGGGVTLQLYTNVSEIRWEGGVDPTWGGATTQVHFSMFKDFFFI